MALRLLGTVLAFSCAITLILTAVPEAGTLIPDLENQVFVLASYADGKPATADIKVQAPGNPDQTVATYGHTYSRPGDYTIAAYGASVDFLHPTCPPNPYASQGTATAAIHVG